jgi:hypothetical protein
VIRGVTMVPKHGAPVRVRSVVPAPRAAERVAA